MPPSSCAISINLPSLVFNRRVTFLRPCVLWSVFLIVFLSTCCQQTSAQKIVNGKLVFKDVKELKKYLVKQLLEYYMLHGRPRWALRTNSSSNSKFEPLKRYSASRYVVSCDHGKLYALLIIYFYSSRLDAEKLDFTKTLSKDVNTHSNSQKWNANKNNRCDC